MQYVKVKDLSIAFSRSGNGTPIVLLHGGLNHNSQAWKPQIKSLQKYFRVIAWDAPGAGMSADTPENFDMNDWTDYLAEFLKAIKISQAHILGLSWGGLIAQVFYNRYPNYVLSLILCDTYTGWKGSLSESEANARLTAVLQDASLPPAKIASKYISSMFSDSVSQEVKEEMIKILSSNFHPFGFRNMAKTMIMDTQYLLPKIKVPTLLIWDEKDKRSPLKVAQQFHHSIIGSKLEIIPGVGHLTNSENPEMFNKIVKDFCLNG